MEHTSVRWVTHEDLVIQKVSQNLEEQVDDEATMIEARVLTHHGSVVEADYGLWRFVALPRIGESISLWSVATDLPASGKVTAIYHHPQGDHGPHPTAYVTINIALNR